MFKVFAWYLQGFESELFMYTYKHMRTKSSINTAVAESVQHMPPVSEVGSSIPNRIKQITHKFDTRRLLAWCSALIGWSKNWLAQCPDDVTRVGYWIMLPGGLISQWDSTIKSPCVHCHKSVPISRYDLTCFQDVKLQQPMSHI